MAGEEARAKQRLESVRILLRTLNDIYPGPTTLQQPAAAGSAPSRRVPCGVCNKSSHQPRGQLSSCPGCDGDGWRRRRRGDTAEWDEYTGQVIATSEQPKKAEPMSPARLDAELARVQRDLRLSEGLVDPNEAYGWERERERRDRDASYRELERALDVMQIELPIGRSVINGLYLGGLEISVPAHVDEALVSWLAERMPRRVRVPRRFYEAQQEERRARIRELSKLGWTDEEIVEELGVSRKFIGDVLAGTMQVSAGAAVTSRSG